jgi:hypothetical protein
MMGHDDRWTARMQLARSQDRWRQGIAERRRADRRDEIARQNYSDHVRRERLVARAYEAEEARRRHPNGRLVLSAAERLRRYAVMDQGKQVRNSGEVYGVR